MFGGRGRRVSFKMWHTRNRPRIKEPKAEIRFQENKWNTIAEEARDAARRYFQNNYDKDKIIEDLKWELEGLRKELEGLRKELEGMAKDRNRWRERCLNFIDKYQPIVSHKPVPS